MLEIGKCYKTTKRGLVCFKKLSTPEQLEGLAKDDNVKSQDLVDFVTSETIILDKDIIFVYLGPANDNEKFKMHKIMLDNSFMFIMPNGVAMENWIEETI